MTTATGRKAAVGPELRPLVVKEMGRYARHPLFLVGAALTAVSSVMGADVRTSSLFHVIVPAAGIGLFGIVLMAALTRSSDRVATATGSPSANRWKTLPKPRSAAANRWSSAQSSGS